MRILSVVGTRPELIKNLAFVEAAKNLPDIDLKIVHTNQNFGHDMSDQFIHELGLTIVRQNGPVDRTSWGASLHSIYDFIVACVKSEKPDVLISLGDTDTAFLASLASARNDTPVAHVEGGIMTGARNNPEEINRRLSDQMATWHFPVMQEHQNALKDLGFSDQECFMCGDITFDALRITLDWFGISPIKGEYNVLTVHRQENTGSPDRLMEILRAVEDAGIRTIFPVHPRTQTTIDQSEAGELLSTSKVIQTCPPAGYAKMVELLAGCGKVLTDSGGVRREAYLLGKPLITLVPFVWFKEIKEAGYKFTADADYDNILWAIGNFDPPGSRPQIFGDSHAGMHILEKLLEVAQA